MVLYTAAIALAFGMAAQAVAVRFAIPGILLLLLTGMAIGPDGLGLLETGVLGPARTQLVNLAVTVILFEGALGLRRERLQQHQSVLLRLLTVGGLVSMVIGALAARLIIGVPWSTALLYGSLMIVTGPTVVTPLLSRLTVHRSLRELLISEGVLIDPLGAIAAIVVAESVLGMHGPLEAAPLLLLRLGLGALIGVTVGFAMVTVLRRGWVREDLWNPTVLASAILAATFASRWSGEAGLMTAVAQGVVMGNAGLHELGRLRQFNEEVTVLLLSFIFVILAADLPFSAVAGLGGGGLVVVLILMWVARPLSVALSTIGSELTVRQRLFLAWVCPRGIVAASVAGLFAIWLDEAGIGGGRQLEALVFVTVAVTVAVQGSTVGWVARLLRLDSPAQRAVIIVGANPLGRLLGRLFDGAGHQVVLIDRNPTLADAAGQEGLPVLTGDALAVETLDGAGARYADALLAATTNAELNVLIAERARQAFSIQHVLPIGEDSVRGPGGTTAVPFPGAFPGTEEVNRQLRAGRLELAAYEVDARAAGRPLKELPFAAGEFAVLLLRHGEIELAHGELQLQPGDRLLCAAPLGAPVDLAALLTPVGRSDTHAPGALLATLRHPDPPAGPDPQPDRR